MKKTLLITGTVLAGITAVCVIIIVLTINNFRNEYRASENAIDAILHELKHRKIIAIGEHHDRVNEELFIAENIQALYNAGVRYIFIEGGSSLDEEYFFLMFYPWMYSGWRYEENAMYQAISDFNKSLHPDEKINIVSPEKIPPDNIAGIIQHMNFRDSSAAETIIEIMDSAAENTRAIILYGAYHTRIYPFKNHYDAAFDETFDWMPLGYHLKNYYGNDYASYFFVTNHEESPVIKPRHLFYKPKLVYKNNILFANIPFLKDAFTFLAERAGYDRGHDGFIIEPETIQGTFYQYNPTNLNLSFIFKFVEDYALEFNSDINYVPFEPDNRVVFGINYLKENLGENFDYANPGTTYALFEMQGQFMLGIYYLKLYFGDKFDYSFWKTESTKSLLSALSELKDYAFLNNTPAEYVRINYNHDILGLYHKYMNLSNIEYFNTQEVSARNIWENYLLNARGLFPEDLWPLYWLGFAAAEKEQWEKGLGFFQELFADDLSFSMEGLPLTYQKAALCAEKLGNNSLADKYNRIAGTLYNDFNIVVDKNRSSYVGYSNGPW